jgi:hypothetical protein
MGAKKISTIWISVLVPLAMFALSIFLFFAAYNVEMETMTDKIMVSFAYICASLCLLAGIIMSTPFGRRMSARGMEIRKQEKALSSAKFKENPLRYTLQKTVVNQLPILVVLALLYIAGTFSSLLALLVGWCAVVLIYFLITYFCRK